MMPLFDMMLKAQDGAAMDMMARQFGLAQEQVTQAVAALTPAFSFGLKRAADNPADLAGLFSSLSKGNYAQYFEDLGRVFTPQGIADGNHVLQQLFGSKEMSRAIAAQAAQVTGVGQDILKQMMPVMADTLMGGLFKQSLRQMQDAQTVFSTLPMGPMIQQWLESAGFAPKPQRTSSLPFDNPFFTAWREMMGVEAAKPEQQPANPFLDNPIAKAWQEMMQISLGQPRQPEKPKPTPQAEARQAMVDAVSGLFDSGLEMQKSYQSSMEKIFETYMKGPAQAEASSGEVAGHEATAGSRRGNGKGSAD
ncbi:DUF937 domain-containing protein [Allorhizobium sp. BGMRC 0089]|uniref:DUF937 domain-containing protein n=1 Tax=Allorhizobium sonneratiae TaxID=2934936 RepID=UPI0020339F28|nr:DUF937 domain-containing protein [Allorhizobium sonneratiae]MCM2293845.1 DUF937 domain-containing protein [Allorhizobium sonneratiae]